MKVLKLIPSGENIKKVVLITFETIVYWSMITLGLIILGLMMFFALLMDNIQDFYSYLFKGKFMSRPPLFLTQSYRLVRYGIRVLKKRLFGLISHLRLPN